MSLRLQGQWPGDSGGQGGHQELRCPLPHSLGAGSVCRQPGGAGGQCQQQKGVRGGCAASVLCRPALDRVREGPSKLLRRRVPLGSSRPSCAFLSGAPGTLSACSAEVTHGSFCPQILTIMPPVLPSQQERGCRAGPRGAGVTAPSGAERHPSTAELRGHS